ncbi:MAG: type IV secretion system DNA-binding domain-containing protein [Betaproteobacteria bacterium]|nr:type IV secretion system DNA-binding domain-containing protein [Betaproteobacteria bacterium]MDE2623377.1 type IV secretion system DNA-binding domain-containing protein [Betaproteobacteria bacterium]
MSGAAWLPWPGALLSGLLAGRAAGLGWLAASTFSLACSAVAAVGEGPVLRRAWRRQAGLRTRKLTASFLERWVRRHPQHLLLGHGAPWRTREARRFLLAAAAPDLRQHGSPFDHTGLSRVLRLPASGSHTLVVGAPGTGKTQLFALLAVQAIARGDAVVLLDPKGGHALRERLAAAAARFGRPSFRLLAAEPETSDALDLLAHGRTAGELASRVARLMPADESDNSFGQFAWMTLHRLIEAQRALGEVVTLQRLREHVADQGQALLRRLQASGVAAEGALAGLTALAAHDPAHYRKMILALAPVLETLCGAALGPLLSDLRRPRVTLGQIVRQGGVLYAGLGALSDEASARALGALLLADLAALAGNRYRGDGEQRPIRLFVDEAAEVTNPAFIQLLNKGRECGVQVTFAVQTLADLEVAMGGEAPARMMLGNAGNLVAFRLLDAGSREAWSARAGQVWARLHGSAQGSQQGSGPTGRSRSRNAGRSEVMQEVPLLPEALLAQLPDLAFAALLGGQQVVLGRLPLLAQEGA